jgi:regulator of RNase E activity RraA
MNAVLGDLISTKARHRGVKGFVVDGLIRDLPAIRALGDFPVFARGVTPIGPLHRGPGLFAKSNITRCLDFAPKLLVFSPIS